MDRRMVTTQASNLLKGTAEIMMEVPFCERKIPADCPCRGRRDLGATFLTPVDTVDPTVATSSC